MTTTRITPTGVVLYSIQGGGEGNGKPRGQLYIVPDWYEGTPRIRNSVAMPEEVTNTSNITLETFRQHSSTIRKQISRIDAMIAEMRANNDPRLRGGR